jgi:hypothetical protein
VSDAFGVGHPIESLSDVRRANAVCAQNTSPEGVTRRLQVCAYSIEPHPAVIASRLAANLSDNVAAGDLLPEDDIRAARGDEAEERGPEVALVFFAFTLPRRAVRLTRTTPGPDGTLSGPSGEPEGFGPAPDPGEEVALSSSHKVNCTHFLDASLIDGALRDQVVGHQFAEPRGRARVELVEVVRHAVALRAF